MQLPITFETSEWWWKKKKKKATLEYQKKNKNKNKKRVNIAANKTLSSHQSYLGTPFFFLRYDGISNLRLFFLRPNIATREEEEEAPQTSQKEAAAKSWEEEAFIFWEVRECMFWCG